MFEILTLLLGIATAHAQTCPTRPLGDNSNACASTKFVQDNAITPSDLGPGVQSALGNAVNGPNGIVVEDSAGKIGVANVSTGGLPATIYVDLYGVKASNSGTTNVTNFNALIAASASLGYREFRVREIDVPLSGDIVMPVGSTTRVDIVCEGKVNGFKFTGTNTYGFRFGNPASVGLYEYVGNMRHCNISNTGTASRGVTFINSIGGGVYDSIIRSFTGAAVYVKSSLMTTVQNSFFIGNGSTEAAIVVTGDDNISNYTTTFSWYNNLLDGGAAPSGSSGRVGLSIDRTTSAVIHGGAIESTGLPIKIGGQASSTIAPKHINVTNIDLEAPADTLGYIDIGSGWSGAAGALANITIGPNVTGSVSGAVDVRYGVQAANTSSLIVDSNTTLALTGGSVIGYVNLTGTNNVGTKILGNTAMNGAPGAYAVVNGSQDKCASPYIDYVLNQCQAAPGQKIVSGATVDGAINSQGGSYLYYYLNNGAATNMTNLTNIPYGVTACLNAGNGNTTIKQAAGGAGSFYNSTGADITMGANTVRCYLSSGNDGNLHAIQ